ncbi:L-iditol 2-dehydrogenase [Pseudomonas moraviensis subsp. stanleyae]|uniref:L-iditol 2-dehydrogenase n=1 Tax=Pseudomonas moraviensis TaxID=321662 RepID=UPI002E30B319|nr:L-iditol 2-dehydrogenase [Pseudomonas moraviensis]MED7666683.1 L-iditol 2-dehydrogenase [Pseudomonas moraviensis subsp. stanleyae]
MKLSGKVAVVTGAGSGIGQAVARAYVEQGACCLLVDLKSEADLRQTFEDVPAQRLATLSVDLSTRENIQAVVATAVETFGRLDILFNNAAVFDMGPFLDESWDAHERIFSVNVRSMFFLLQASARQMVMQGEGGKIINMASQAGRRGEALVAHYCASKAAVISYTQSAGLALAKDRINVNGIAPGVVDTPMWDKVDSLFARYENLAPGEKKRQVGAAVPWGRMGVSQDFVGAAVFLASQDSDYVTAQTLNVDGGNWMS